MSIEVVENEEAVADFENQIAEQLAKAERFVHYAQVKEREALVLRNQAEACHFQVRMLRKQIGAYRQRGDA